MQQIAPITNTEQVPSIGSIKTADVQFAARCFLHGGNFRNGSLSKFAPAMSDSARGGARRPR